MKNIIKKIPFLNKLLLYLWQKKHNGDKVKFWYSTHISYRCRFEGMNMVAQRSSYKSPFVTTSPLFFSLSHGRNPQMKTFAKMQMLDEFRYYDKERKLVNKIGNDCWIGLEVTLIGGVEIADGAVVLAHAVVTKNVPPYAIVGGVPARVVGYRYDKETIDFLLHVKWWNNTPEWFEKNWKLLTDIDKLKEYYGKEH